MAHWSVNGHAMSPCSSLLGLPENTRQIPCCVSEVRWGFGYSKTIKLHRMQNVLRPMQNPWCSSPINLRPMHFVLLLFASEPLFHPCEGPLSEPVSRLSFSKLCEPISLQTIDSLGKTLLAALFQLKTLDFLDKLPGLAYSFHAGQTPVWLDVISAVSWTTDAAGERDPGPSQPFSNRGFWVPANFFTKKLCMSLDAQPSARLSNASDESTRSAASDLDQSHPLILRAVINRELQQLCSTFEEWLPDLSRLHGVAGMIDAYHLAPSRWSYRDGDLFQPDTSDDSETQLPGTDSSTVPLLIRPWPEGVEVPANFPLARYEVLSGFRRLMARLRCTEQAANASRANSALHARSSAEELMAEILIPVVLLHLDDQEAACVVIHSNQGHRPLRPIEWGHTYKKLLDSKVFKSQKELARVMHRQESEVSRGLALAGLDPVVLGAFRSPLELHYTDGPTLKQAWEDDAERLIHRAELAAQDRGMRDRKAVLAALLGTLKEDKPIKEPSMDYEVVVLGVLYFVISTTAAGATKVKVMCKHLCAQAIDMLVRTLEAMGEKDDQDLFKPE